MPILVAVGLFALAGLIGVRALAKIAVSSFDVTLKVDSTAPLVAGLVYKGWFRFSFRVLAGDIWMSSDSDCIELVPTTFAVSATSLYAMTEIRGIKAGTATITVSGSSAEGSHDDVTVAVTVTP